MKKILLIILSIYMFTACSSKLQEQEYNKPAVYWYNKMLKNISMYDLDSADDTFTSLQSEHRNSSLIPSALMIIANAHIQNEEYQLAIYYYDLYSEKFEDKSLQDYVRYLKIKAKFMAFEQRFRDQKLINDTLNDIDIFIDNYSSSEYIELVKTMQSRLSMSQAVLNIEIADLYKRKDKAKAASLYITKAKSSWSDINTIKDLDIPWYRSIFE